MAKHPYKIASEDAAFRYKAEVGDTVDLDLDADEKRAVIAAGWLEEVTAKPDHAAKPAKDKE